MYFTLTQFQYLGLAIFMGLLVIAVLGIAIWSYRLNMKAKANAEDSMVTDEQGDHEFADGLREGNNGIPLIIILLITFLILWGVGYTLAHAFGVFYAQ